MRKGDEFLDYLLDINRRRSAKAKPRYGYGDMPSQDDVNFVEDIPEDQFFDEEEKDKHE